jgi:hypothetical protein
MMLIMCEWMTVHVQKVTVIVGREMVGVTT